MKPRKRAVSVPSSRLQETDAPQPEPLGDEEFTNVKPAFYLTPDQSYARKAIELSFLVDLEEVLGSGNESPQDTLRQKLQEALLTSQAKRMKVEVRERLLTDEEKQEFREAKKGEWMSFVENIVVELALRSGVDPSRIIGSRWVLTWKNVDGKSSNSKTQKAKARLVLLGYQDPDLGKYTRSSPTLTKTGRFLLFALMAQFMWQVFSLDAKNAFLAGDLSSRSKPLYMMVPQGLLQMLGLPPDAIFKLKKSAYGLAEAPIAWFRCLRAKLEKLNWKAHPLDECV